MRIGELSRTTGVSVRALRYYEEKGVLAPERTASGYRVFDQSAVAAVAQIRVLLSAGLGMELIAEMLSCMSGEIALAAACRERLLAERRRMNGDIERIQAARSMLDRLLDGSDVAELGPL